MAMSPNEYHKIMNMAYAMGTVFAYLLSAFCISLDMWSLPYFVIGGIFLLSGLGPKRITPLLYNLRSNVFIYPVDGNIYP